MIVHGLQRAIHPHDRDQNRAASPVSEIPNLERGPILATKLGDGLRFFHLAEIIVTDEKKSGHGSCLGFRVYLLH